MTMPGDKQAGDPGSRLRALREDPPDDGFSASLHRRLSAAGAPDEPSFWRRLWPRALAGRALWPAAGLAAGVAAFLVLGALRSEPRQVLPGAAPALARAGASVQLPATKVAMVRVNLSAEVAVESALIRVSLPEGLVFWSDGQELAQRSFEWSQPLSAGANDIPIAVRGHHPGHYRLAVRAVFGGQEVEDEVLIEVVDG